MCGDQVLGARSTLEIHLFGSEDYIRAEFHFLLPLYRQLL